MANDVNANIRVNLDTSQALAGLQSLQSRISSFNQSVIQSNAQAVAAQRNLLSNFQAQVGASRQFSTSITNVETSVGRLQTAIDKNRLSMGQYFRYGVASSKNFGKVFRQENEAITRLATERVQKLQTQYVALGQAQGGMTKALAVRPLQMFNADSAIAIQKSQIFNKLLQDGSTSLVNWGKNTQWAGRQLMVGFTVPLTIFGGLAAKTFMELEEQAISFRKVYGDIFTTEAEVEENLAAVRELTQEMTKYGIAASETFELANVAAQSGARGADLQAQTRQATRLAVLGQMEQQEAIKTTITLQNAFQLSNEDLADSINFLNIVENQSVLSLQDVAGAIPRVAPVIKSLGGDVRDLSVMLVAMREGGVSAAEGANALKTSLARLISPTAGASKMAKEMGINLNSIVEANQGDILGAVLQLAGAMEKLDELSQQRLLSEIFGKRQYARVGALFNNITNEASQAQRVLDLTTMSTEDLAATADKELGAVEQSISTKFTAAVELLKTEIAPIGEQFLKLATPIVEAVSKIFAKFNDLSPTVKNFVTILTAGVGVVVPIVLMLVGLFGNLLGNLAKGIATLSGFFARIRNGAEAVQYLAGNQLEAEAAAASLEGRTTRLTGSLNVQREAVEALTRAYNQYVAGANAAAASLPQGFRTPAGPTVAPTGMATGGMVGGIGNKDTEPALLTPGEFVINADASKKFAPLLAAINEGRVGKYARGRTEGNISFGRLGSVNIPAAYGQVSIDRIQAMADDLAGAGDDVRLAFKQILEDLSQTQGLTKGMVQQAEALKSSQFPEISKMAGESKYSASKAGEKRSIEAQLREDLADRANNEQLIAQEYARAQAAIDGSIISLNEYYDGLVRNANSEEEIEAINDKRLKHIQEASRMDRAHIVELTNAQKLERESWNARLWMPQSGIENQLSNMLARSENNQAIYEQYLMDLADTSVSEDQRLQILEKVRGNIALTDSELDIQARVLQNIVEDAERNAILVRKANGEFAKMSAEFIPYAQGAIGAAGGRAAMGPVDPAVQAERIAMSQGVIGGFRDDIRANSPSEAAADVADSVPEGVAKGIKRSTPQATAAARELAQEVEGQLMMEFEDDDALFPAAPYKGERRLQPTRQPTSTPTQEQQPYPLPVAPKSVQDDLARATKNASTGLNNAGNQASQTAKRFAGLKGSVTKFGGALKNGSMKMQGAFFAFDGLVFAASMMNNSFGEIAQKALPVVFGLQGVSMVLPMLMTPWGAAIAGVAALAAGAWMAKSKLDDVREAGANFAKKLYGSGERISSVAEALEKQTYSAQLAGIVSSRQTGEVATEETISEAEAFLATEVGKTLISEIEGLSKSSGLSVATEALKNQLQRAVLEGVMPPSLANQIALQVGESLGNTKMSLDVIGQMQQVFGPDGELLETQGGRLQIYADIFSTLQDPQQMARQASEIWDQQGFFGRLIGGLFGEAESTVLGQQMMTGVTESMTALNSEFDRNLLLLQQGNIGYEEFLDNQALISAAARQQGVGWEGATESLENYYGTGSEDAVRSIRSLQNEIKTTAQDVIKFSISPQDQDRVVGYFNEVNSLGADIATQISDLSTEQLPLLEQAFREVSDESGNIHPKATQEQYDKAKKDLDDMQKRLSELRKIRDFELDVSVALSTGTLTAESLDALFSGKTEAEQKQIKLQIGAMPSTDAQILFSMLERADGNELVLDTIFDIATSADSRELSNIQATLAALDVAQISTSVFLELPSQQAQSALKQIADNLVEFDKIPKKAKKSRFAEYFSTNYEMTKEELDTFMKLPYEQKRYLTTIFTAFFAEGGSQAAKQFLIESGQLTYQGAGQIPEAALPGLGASQLFREPPIPTEEETTEEELPEDTSGGSDEESFLEGLINTFTANMKLFNTAEGAGKKYIAARGKFFGMLEQLRKEGIPEGIIAMIGTGAKGVENARELLNATAKERRELLRLYGSVVAGEAADEIRVQTSEAIIERDALRNIQGGGLSQNLQDFIMANEKLTLAFAGVKKGSKEYKELVKLAKELLGIEKERDELAKSTSDKLKEQYDNLDRSRQIILDSIDLEMAKNRNALYEEFAQNMGTTPEMLEHTIKMREHEINQLERQVDRYDEIIAAEQERIEGIQSQIDGKEREIAISERQNELDQRQIEKLNREDELRNRVADALSRELQQMSDMEGKIRDAYQDRIDALDKVAQVNDYIIGQQRQQLDLSKAISEGDIYAATAAVQEMRATSAGFARTQVRAGLEAGMENQIAGLRTSGGLTREQAEQQIANIQEQSYQTSLSIRDIEDDIYDRNLKIIPLKDDIYNLNEDIYEIEQEIVKQEGLKKTLLVEQIEPLQWANTAQQRLLEDLEKEVDEQNGPLAARQRHMKRHFDISTMQQNLNHSLWLQTEAIANGTKKARNRASELAANYGEAARNALATAAAVASIAGGAPVNAYAGGMIQEYGMGGKIKKYRGGGVVSGMQALAYGGPVYGNGGRDSVPAMLMPGEFVVRKAMVEKYGEGLMRDINMGSFAMPSYKMEAEMGTPVVQSNNMVSNINAPVYNSYDMKFAINGANQSADEIANTVMFKMRQLQNQGIRTNRGY